MRPFTPSVIEAHSRERTGLMEAQADYYRYKLTSGMIIYYGFKISIEY